MTIRMPDRTRIQQSSARSQNPSQIVRSTDRVLAAGQVTDDCDVLGILDATAAGEAVPSAEYFDELLVCQISKTICSCADLAGEHGRELAVEIYQLLCNCMALGVVGVEDGIWLRAVGLRCESVDTMRQLPRKVVSVHHRHIHPLACLWAVGMTS